MTARTPLVCVDAQAVDKVPTVRRYGKNGQRAPPVGKQRPAVELVSPKYRPLLDDPKVMAWHRKMCNGSPKTGRKYIDVLGLVMARLGTTPSTFIAQGEEACEEAVHDYVARRQDGEWATDDDEGTAGSSTKMHADVVRSWMAHNRLRMFNPVKVRKANFNPRHKEGIPNRDELRRTLLHADARARILITSMAYSLMRPEVLSDNMRMEGLRYRDLPETHFDGNGHLVIEKRPTLVQVPDVLSKNGRGYPTFYTHEQCDYLEADVRKRIADGEVVTKDSLVVAPKYNCRRGIMSNEALSRIARVPMRAAGIERAPYSWKSYGGNRMLFAQTEMGFPVEYKEVMMGHGGDIESVYATHKGLPPDMLEAMRSKFDAVATKYLEAFPRTEQGDGKAEALGGLLQLVGYDANDLARMGLGKMDADAFLKTLHAGPKAKAMVKPGAQAREFEQQIVSTDAMVSLLAGGWNIKMQLQDGRVVMERPIEVRHPLLGGHAFPTPAHG